MAGGLFAGSANNSSPQKQDAIVQRANWSLSKAELDVCRFLWCQMNKATDADMQLREANAILRTVCSRLVKYNEASSLNSLIDGMVKFDLSSIEFDLSTPVQRQIASLVRMALSDPSSFTWDDSSVVFWSRKGWAPSESDKANYDWSVAYTSTNYDFWRLKLKSSKTPTAGLQLTPNAEFLARVIYSETSICDQDEVKLVCRVIMNRVGKRDFGDKTYSKPSSAYEVVNVKVSGRAFSCIGDRGNSNWDSFRPDLNAKTKQAAEYAKLMMSGDKSFTDSLSEYRISSQDLDSIVYYHNRKLPSGQDMPCPPSWTNKYWRPILVLTTKHFKFYKIVPNKKTS